MLEMVEEGVPSKLAGSFGLVFDQIEQIGEDIRMVSAQSGGERYFKRRKTL
jgi:hypothetical protein